MKFIIVMSLVLLVGCGKKVGPAGKNGLDGNDGKNGYSLVINVTQVTINSINCNQTDIFTDLNRDDIYSSGDYYQNGFLTCDGTKGKDGENGLSAYEIAVEHGFSGSESDYLNSLKGQKGDTGATGAQGPIGPQGPVASSAYNIVSVVDPCGTQSSYDEVLLKLGNGQYLASFSAKANGENTRFAVLTAGTYITTDGTNCRFTINSNGTISY